MIKQAFFVLLLVGIPFAALAKTTSAKNAAPAASLSTPTPSFQAKASGVRAPYANEEAKYYNKAWPIKEAHSLWALILMGSVLTIIFTLLIRKMAQSPPRKQKEP